MKNPIPKKYNTIILTALAGLVAVILIAVFLMSPAWSELQKLGTEIPQEEQARDVSVEDIKNLESAQKFFGDNAQSVETVNTAVPIEPEVPAILAILEDLAKQNGVFLTSFSPQQFGGQANNAAAAPAAGGSNQQADPPGVNSVEVTANFRGPYTSLINFLYSLEHSLRLVDVKTITVTSTGGALEGNISFKAYYKVVDGGPKPTTSSAGTTGGSNNAAASTPPPSGGSK